MYANPGDPGGSGRRTPLYGGPAGPAGGGGGSGYVAPGNLFVPQSPADVTAMASQMRDLEYAAAMANAAPGGPNPAMLAALAAGQRMPPRGPAGLGGATGAGSSGSAGAGAAGGPGALPLGVPPGGGAPPFRGPSTPPRKSYFPPSGGPGMGAPGMPPPGGREAPNYSAGMGMPGIGPNGPLQPPFPAGASANPYLSDAGAADPGMVDEGAAVDYYYPGEEMPVRASTGNIGFGPAGAPLTGPGSLAPAAPFHLSVFSSSSTTCTTRRRPTWRTCRPAIGRRTFTL